MELIEITRKDLEIGKEYYFDKSLQSSGIFVKRTKQKIKFKPIGVVVYEVKRGTVDFDNNNTFCGFYLKP